MHISSKLVNEILKSSSRVGEALMEKAEEVSRKLFHNQWEKHFDDIQDYMMENEISLTDPTDKIVKQFKQNKYAKVYVGDKGLEESWQAPFEKFMPCENCGKQSELAFVNKEQSGDKEFICDLHKNLPKTEGYWPHDAIAVAVYICRHCFELTAKWNQG